MSDDRDGRATTGSWREAERIKALGEAAESVAPYPVNQPTISAWLDAMG